MPSFVDEVARSNTWQATSQTCGPFHPHLIVLQATCLSTMQQTKSYCWLGSFRGTATTAFSVSPVQSFPGRRGEVIPSSDCRLREKKQWTYHPRINPSFLIRSSHRLPLDTAMAATTATTLSNIVSARGSAVRSEAAPVATLRHGAASASLVCEM